MSFSEMLYIHFWVTVTYSPGQAGVGEVLMAGDPVYQVHYLKVFGSTEFNSPLCPRVLWTQRFEFP